jgi:hypothetical protein
MRSEFTPLVDALRAWLQARGLGADAASAWAGVIVIVGALLLGIVLQVAARVVIDKHVRAWVARTSTGFDDLLHERRVFSRLARLAPGALVFLAAPLALAEQASSQAIVKRAALIYMLIVVAGTAHAVLDAVDVYYRRFANMGVPIKGPSLPTCVRQLPAQTPGGEDVRHLARSIEGSSLSGEASRGA